MNLMNNYVLNSEEYETLDQVLTGSHLGDYLELRQKGTKLPTFPVGAYDYFKDHEENQKLTLKEGLELIYEAAVDYKECYGMSEEEIEVFRQLLIKLKVITEEDQLS